MKTYLSSKPESESKTKTHQYSTFYLDGRLYGIDVMKVQEVTSPLQITQMRTAPSFIKGLINLRGQIATAIDLKRLFQIGETELNERMTVVCKLEDVLLSLQVDGIGDVIEVRSDDFEPTPLTIPKHIRCFMKGVYKTNNGILSVLELDSILSELDKKCA